MRRDRNKNRKERNRIVQEKEERQTTGGTIWKYLHPHAREGSDGCRESNLRR